MVRQQNFDTKLRRINEWVCLENVLQKREIFLVVHFYSFSVVWKENLANHVHLLFKGATRRERHFRDKLRNSGRQEEKSSTKGEKPK